MKVLFIGVLTLLLTSCGKNPRLDFANVHNTCDKELVEFILRDSLYGVSLTDYCNLVYPQYGRGDIVYKCDKFYIMHFYSLKTYRWNSIDRIHLAETRGDTGYSVVAGYVSHKEIGYTESFKYWFTYLKQYRDSVHKANK